MAHRFAVGIQIVVESILSWWTIAQQTTVDIL